MLELLRQAAAEKGWLAEILPFPDGEPQPRLDQRRVATVAFKEDANTDRDPLFQDALARRTTRAVFDASKPVSLETLNQLMAAPRAQSSAGGTLAEDKRARLIDFAARSWNIEHDTNSTRRETIKLIRIGNHAVAENPDGIALSGIAMGFFKMLGIVTPKTLDTPGSQAYEQGLQGYLDLINSARGFVWLASETNTRRDQINAGRDWVRMNLAAQSAGLAIHPLSQALQEFPEMAGPYDELRTELGVAEGGAVQMLARIGYAPFPEPSPRWPLSSRFVEAAE